jgi:hypothetical protein
VKWLATQEIPLFEAGGITWARYRSALMPADPTLPFVQVEPDKVRHLLRRISAPFARWSTDPSSEPTEWWHTVCSQYSHAELSSNTRSKVNRGLKRNVVRPVTPVWLAANGYSCYAESFRRYGGAKPAPAGIWRSDLEAQRDAPVEVWGVFDDGQLGGYAWVVVDERRAALSSVKLDPRILPGYGSYALLSVLLEELVAVRGVSIQNGARAIAHETEMQDFLLKFGFERKYGRLEVVYSPLGLTAAHAARWIGPLRRVAPPNVRAQLRTLALQERIRRATRVGVREH